VSEIEAYEALVFSPVARASGDINDDDVVVSGDADYTPTTRARLPKFADFS
jgi:hypothetical protein